MIKHIATWEYVRRNVSAGNYDSPENMVEEALRLLQAGNRRQKLADEISAYAERDAGSLDDLDEDLETAGIECLTDDDES